MEQRRKSETAVWGCSAGAGRQSVLGVCGPHPSTPSFSGKGVNAGWKSPPVPGPLSTGPAQAVTFSRWALSGQGSSFSAPGQALLHLKPPHSYIFLFSRRLWWVPLFLHRRGTAHLRAKVAGLEATRGAREEPVRAHLKLPGPETGIWQSHPDPCSPRARLASETQPLGRGFQDQQPSLPSCVSGLWALPAQSAPTRCGKQS